jgi:CTP-dependent riboflavin kinase
VTAFKCTYIQSLKGRDCDTDHHLVVAKVRERLAVSKQTTHRVHMKSLNLKKLNEVDGKEQYHVEISNRFTALVNLDIKVDINRAWETIRENIKISGKERPTTNNYDGHPTHNRTPASVRTFKAAISKKPNKIKCNHVQPKNT